MEGILPVYGGEANILDCKPHSSNWNKNGCSVWETAEAIKYTDKSIYRAGGLGRTELLPMMQKKGRK